MSVVIDVAGSNQGGAARFLTELDSYVDQRDTDARIIGRNSPLTARWLGWREYAARGAGVVVATNNVSFIGSRGQRCVLLRNALHFLTESEASRALSRPRSIIVQTPVVRAAARRADIIVVPCTEMANRVVATDPSLAERVTVRHHPVTPLRFRDTDLKAHPFILAPVLFASYKKMPSHIHALLTAMSEVSAQFQLRLTASTSEVPQYITDHPSVKLLGRLSPGDMESQWNSCSVVFFPTGVESFGYPLAEARANGIPVIAQDTAQNREVAGPALCGFFPNDEGSLSGAVQVAAGRAVVADAEPFDPASYFDLLLGRRCED